MRHEKGESCWTAFESYPSKVLHTCQWKPDMPLACGYTYPRVADVVGFHCSRGRGVSSAAEVPTMTTEQIPACRPPHWLPTHRGQSAWAVSWKNGRCLSWQTGASRKGLKAQENYLWEVILPWEGSVPSFAARFKNLSAKDQFTLASEELKINYVYSEKL